MQVISVVGSAAADTTALVERLVGRLADRGTVATVEHVEQDPRLDTEGTDTARHRDSGADATYSIATDGTWFATGEARSLDATLDHLATDVDYCVVEGYSQARLPQVRLGDREAADDVVYEAADVDAVDLDELVEVVESLDPYESLESLVAAVKESPDADLAGAIATFTGRVREREGEEDRPTTHLEFERYDEVAAERRATIREELEAREGVHEVLLYHRTGIVEAGADIVHVVVLAGHRTEGFAAVEDGINRLKEEVPIFKKEVTVEDATWAHQR